MSFLGLPALWAWLLVFLTAALLVTLYLLRPPPSTVVVPSNLIWHRVIKGRRDKSDSRRWWLSLLLALGIGVLMALASARPQWGPDESERRERVLVIDNSTSMAARTRDGRTRWEHGLERARALVGSPVEGNEIRILDTCGQIENTTAASRAEALGRLDSLQVQLGCRPRVPREWMKSGEIYLVSDGIGVGPAGEAIHLVSVFEPAGNVALSAFDIRAVPADPARYEALVEISNFSETSRRVELEVVSSGGERITRPYDIDPGASLADVLDVSSSPGGALRATITSPGDAFDADNVAYAYMRGRRRLRVLLVSREAKGSLETALRIDPRVELFVAEPPHASELMDDPSVDVFVLDGWAPNERPLRPCLIFGPPATPWLSVSEKWVTPFEPVPHPVQRARAHPVMDHVSLDDLDIFVVDRAPEPAPTDFEVLARAADTPLVLLGHSPRMLIVAFALRETSFSQQAAFPIFLTNALTWLAGEDPSLERAPGVVSVPLPGASVRTLDGADVPTQPTSESTLFEAPTPGIYLARHEDERREVIVNLFDRVASDLNRARFPQESTPARPRGGVEGEPGTRLWLGLMTVALGLLALESWTYHRRLTV